ncbi:hypothetical protein Nepgr_031834 [Nepenthes gracilis]|uniref:Uncharacterized protein n=1 Tax=Nepenthes gracilis TaxID=150966 RepID=A0AAD3TJ83_NEPGR|nr:hypothetical protein Nepgr_031834 [Nepenthes gracilis]
MAALIFKSCMAVVLTLSLFAEGMCQCSKDDLTITQSETGTVINGKPEFRVDVFNACPCTQSSVTLDCRGFQTVEKIDHAVLAKNGDDCLVGNGSLIPPFQATFFYYAWDSQFPFKPIFSQPNCSIKRGLAISPSN